jgi:cysteinyl-tRNA synthetase
LGQTLEELFNQALDAMADDLNTPVAIAKALEGARLIAKEGIVTTRASGESASKFLNDVNSLLGIVRGEAPTAVLAIASESAKVDADLVEQRIESRKLAKANRDFGAADAIRQELVEMGVQLQDHPDGTVTWSLG